MMNNPTVTVLSMCYNKAETIFRCYESLRKQTCFDFEWIIVNDGSTDEILSIVSSFKDDLFTIKFINKPNEGIAYTWNRGIQEAKGKFVFRVDPDDWVYDDAIEKIKKYSLLIEKEKKLCGLVFLSTFEDGQLVGYHPFFQEITRCDFNSFRIVYKAKGDRAEVCLTSVFKEFKWPSYNDEHFYPEIVMWTNIAKKYEALYICHPIYIREYNDNSITANDNAVMRKNPKGYMDGVICFIHAYKEYPINLHNILSCLKLSCNYWRYGLYSNVSRYKMLCDLPFIYRFVCPFGICVHFIDKLFPNFIHSIILKTTGRKSLLKRDREKNNN